MSETRQLLSQYVKRGSEDAFGELVNRYIDLVYSAAVRLLNHDTHLAEDVAQTVFLDLARQARTLSPEVMLGGWLHRHTCFVASKTLRAQRRRKLREQHAVEMNPMHDTGAELASVAPILDDAINQLGAEDRTAILARFFEQRDFRGVGEALGSTEEAARKRVNRALEKLHLLLKQRGVTLSVAALGSVLATEAVTAAPVGLAAGVAAGAVAGAAVGNATTLTVLKIMSMTKLKTGLVAALVAALAVPLAMQHRTQTRLLQENEVLQKKVQTVDQLTAENQRLAELLAQATAPFPTSSSQTQSQEVLRLRGEVGRLRLEQAEVAGRKSNGPSPVSALLDNPEIHKRIRAQQRASMGAVFEDFVKSANLASNQVEQFQDLLADNVMTNIARITSVLREGKSREEVEQAFKEQETSLHSSLQALLGPELFSRYQDYTRSLWSRLTSEACTSLLAGEEEVKEQQTQRLRQVMQEEAQAAVASAGLDQDFQLVPFLNFRNIASEEETERNLALLDSVYQRVGARAAEFLSPDELKKFDEFRQYRINENRMILTVNRKTMAPLGKQ